MRNEIISLCQRDINFGIIVQNKEQNKYPLIKCINTLLTDI